MKIGEKIKQLRKNNDLTQEKLADYLGVSYQAISKWECGLCSPDISLIPLLSRLFNVSADELLGITPEITNERKAYFDAEYHLFWTKDDEENEADLEIARQAVAEFPGDFRYLYWLANREWYVGFNVKYRGTEKGKELLESSIKHYLMVFENSDDLSLKNKAISGLVHANKSLNRIDEAKKYALLYPEELPTNRESLLSICLKGDELTTHRQKMVKKGLTKLCAALTDLWVYNNCDKRYVEKALEAEEKILKIIIDDGNFYGFNAAMYLICFKRAEMAIHNGDYEAAIEQLKKAKQHAIEYDNSGNDSKKHTCLLLECCPVNHSYYTDDRSKTSKLNRWKKELSEDKIYDILREHKEFQRLINE